MFEKQLVTKEIVQFEGFESHVFIPINVENPAFALWFCGGSWLTTNPQEFYRPSNLLAKSGVLSVSADYPSLDTRKYTWKNLYEYLKSLREFLIEKYNVNQNKTSIGGSSAGGQLAAMLSIETNPTTTILFNSVLNMQHLKRTKMKKMGQFLFNNFNIPKGELKAISPIHNIDENCSPTLILMGNRDRYIPVEHAYEYQSKMKDKCEVKIYDWEHHSFKTDFSYIKDLERFYLKHKFLDKPLQSHSSLL